MSAYVISEVELRDVAGFEAYLTIAAQRWRTWSVGRRKRG